MENSKATERALAKLQKFDVGRLTVTNLDDERAAEQMQPTGVIKHVLNIGLQKFGEGARKHNNARKNAELVVVL